MLLLMGLLLLLGYAASRVFAVWIDPQTTRCLPYTVYVGTRWAPESIERGHIYVFTASGLAPRFVDGTRLAKRVAALPGDEVRIAPEGVFVNGERLGAINPALMTALGLDPGRLMRTYRVAQGDLLMLGTHPLSYDGRYYGAIKARQILSEVHPLW